MVARLAFVREVGAPLLAMILALLFVRRRIQKSVV